MISGKRVVFYELNEVPRRVLEDFTRRNPGSTLARLLGQGAFFETVAEDQGVLSPWITWPTLHRGVSNDKHCISDFGQDLAEVNGEYPSFTELLARAGVRVGVFGSLHSYPLPPGVEQYAFYVPDTFANGPECFPETLSSFQDFNLKMVDASGRNVSKSVLLGPAARFMAQAPGLGLRFDTVVRLAGQLLSERVNPARVGRRRPELLLGVELGERLADCERIPHRLAVDEQRRHLARRRIRLDAGDAQAAARLVELELHFLEGDGRLARQHPGAHRPGRIVLVADDQLQHGRLRHAAF